MPADRRTVVWSSDPAQASRVAQALGSAPDVWVESIEASEEVMSRVLDDRVDVLIADLGPGSGRMVSALRNIKRVRPRLPVIVLASVFDERFRQEVMPLGILCHFLRDGEGEELAEAVRSALRATPPAHRP